MASIVSGRANRSSKPAASSHHQHHHTQVKHRTTHGHHTHSTHMEDIQKAELEARQKDDGKSMNGMRYVLLHRLVYNKPIPVNWLSVAMTIAHMLRVHAPLHSHIQVYLVVWTPRHFTMLTVTMAAPLS